jgi:hypothetical protein
MRGFVRSARLRLAVLIAVLGVGAGFIGGSAHAAFCFGIPLACVNTGIGPAGVLETQRDHAANALDAGRINAACGVLTAMVNEMNAWSGKLISPSDAQTNIAWLQLAETQNGC